MSRAPLDRYDVIVIGGGIVGTAVSRELAGQGHRVALFERAVLGHGASSRNIGFVWIHGRVGVTLEMARRNRLLLDAFYEEAGGDFEYRRNGGLVLCESEAQLPLIREFVDARRRDGLDVEFVDRDSVLELAPDLHDGVVGASYCHEDAQIGTATVVRALAGVARHHGAEVREGVDVLSVITNAGRVVGVETHEGRYDAPTVVWAGGPWHRLSTTDGQIELPIKSMRNQLIATSPQPPRLRCVLYGAICLASYPHIVQGLPSFSPALFDWSDTLPGEAMMDAISQRSDGAYVFGGPIDSAEFDWSVEIDGVGRVMRRFSRLFPGLRSAGFGHAWAGRIPYTADNLPVVDLHPEIEGLVIAGGFSFGNSSALVGAQVVADLVAGRATSALASELQLARPALAEDFDWSLG